MNRISLSGTWEFRLDDESSWRPITVPGCWEQAGIRKDRSGPAWYRLRFAIPLDVLGQRLWLQFGAVSYHCDIFVNGQAAGSHTGLWDSFRVEITDLVTPGESAELLVRAEKPAGLERGPDSRSLPGRFTLRETLAGFLPYVWGHIFGGIWQDVALVATGQACFEDVLVRGTADGRVHVEATLSAPGVVALELRDPDGTVVVSTAENAESAEILEKKETSAVTYRVRFEAAIRDPRPWAPDHPTLYQARLFVENGDERIVRFGLRSLRADGTTLLLNERPIYPRMALSWGWYPEALHSNPGPERVRADFDRLRQLGYNGVKLCLWFPPQYYFDLADELGMLLWVELPMWLPRPSAFFRAQTPLEYERLLRRARGHPSVILYTLGCELNRSADAELLAPLYALAKAHAGDALVRDNSGSGEAYGGLLNEFAEFYDYHFYGEPQFFRSLLDYFTPRWRPVQPWVFGEFCDIDTFRDLRQLDDRPPTTDDTVRSAADRPSSIVHRPWWTLDDPELNPQGARWQYDIVEQERRLRANGMWERGAEIERISKAQALAYRKHILELVRTYREISGYVVTGETDTPISTAGMWDALGRLKFDSHMFRSFNADLAVLVGWDRRRAWIAGGDRAAPWDTWSYPSGAIVRPHLIASHYGAAKGIAHVAWSAAFSGEPPFSLGKTTTTFPIAPGDLRELAVVEFAAPGVAAPCQAVLSASIQIGDERAENAWPLWIFPRDMWRDLDSIALVDPVGRLRDLAQIAPKVEVIDPQGLMPSPVVRRPSSVVIATVWAPQVQSFVEHGGRAILLQAGAGPAGPLPTAELPFWRETTRLAEPHPAWGDFPLDDALAMQLLGCATDYGLDLTSFSGTSWPILRRLDARTMQLHEYAVELAWGAGRVIVTTLRFEGGQGSQPLGIGRNTAAAYLLRCWADYLLH